MSFEQGIESMPGTAADITSSYLAPSASASVSDHSSYIYSLPSSFYNSTVAVFNRIIPSLARDIFWFPLRLVYRAEIFAFVTAPRYMVQLLGLDEAVAAMADNIAGVAREGGPAAAGGAPLEGMAEMAEDGTPWTLADTIQSLRKFSGFFSYMTSRWSLACFSVVCLVYLRDCWGEGSQVANVPAVLGSHIKPGYHLCIDSPPSLSTMG